MPSQIALPLAPPGSGQPTRIVIGNANQAAYDALANPQGWPFNTAVLTGPPRSGKSLLGLWAAAQGIDVVDDADRHDDAELFHRWNRAQESGRPLLLISGSQPWEIALPDLRSRLGGSLQLEIGAPDDAMIAQMIEAIAQQRGLVLADGALEYLVPRAERSFADIERLVIAIDRLSLERKVPATMSLWRDALESIRGPEQARLL
ncbi:ATPase [Altererythrobacter sp. BO-6]|uniref:DnaA ATPase domain-containing protein n=1 Tax=Altererythrobacter sp. BO-6 TaxID=2604537 RepID=UPI0013E11C0B|nr:DnaA/Hda family protein [Altererythrobacter sp. BO-6]QIG55003.1 ATPase [Altererythrobacter sp. BO-6]